MQNIKDYLKIHKKTLTFTIINIAFTCCPISRTKVQKCLRVSNFKSRHYRPSVMVDYGGKALCANNTQETLTAILKMGRDEDGIRQ